MERAILTSLQNPQVKHLLKLRQSRERARSGLTRVDGARELLRALDAGLHPETVYVCSDSLRSEEARRAVAAALRAGAQRQDVSDEVYAKIRYGDRDEGLCAVVAWSPHRVDQLSAEAASFSVVLQGLEKPGNLGAVLRTADAAGVTSVILADAGLDPSNPNAVRASMGTLFTVPVFAGTSTEVLNKLAALRVPIVAAVVGAEARYTELDLRGPMALAMGPEQDALSTTWREAAAHQVSIPMLGAADSLNVSVATAVLCFEAVRQRAG